MRYIDYIPGEGPKCLTLSTTEVPKLLASQALIKVHSFGINRADTLQRQGKYPAPKDHSPILGLEVSGEIVAMHPKQYVKTDLTLGRKVFALVSGGGYGEYVAVNTSHILPLPNNLSMPEGAAIAECFLTAFQAMFIEAKLQAKQSVLIHAGASGVGLAAIQLAKLQQSKIAVTASNQDKLALCETLGASVLINYQQMDFVEQLKAQKLAIDLVIDFVGGDYLNRNLKVLNQDGSIVSLAMLAGRFGDPLDYALLLSKRARIIGSTLRNRSDEYKTQLIAQFANSHLQHFVSGQLTPVIDTHYSVEQVAITHERLEANQSQGKLICSWENL
ncbi:NAD(P)H-quinone oxidoreductase [Paraglaciecola aestuariivivens]